MRKGACPSSVTPYGVPPSPWRKASSGGGCIHGGRSFSTFFAYRRRNKSGAGAAPLPSRLRRATFPQGKVKSAPAGRKPSPAGKVDRAQPGTDEGKQPKSEKQATLNGSVFHSMWPVSLLGYGPSSVTPYGVPPSPAGKASSRRGILQPRRWFVGKIQFPYWLGG